MVQKHKGSPSGPFALERTQVTLPNTLIATIAVQEVAIALVGLTVGDVATVNPVGALPAGLGISSVRCLEDSLVVALVNPSAGGIQSLAQVLNVSIQHYS